MKLILQDINTYIIRIDKGEDVISKLREFAEQEGMGAAAFSLIGAAGEIELWWYDRVRKEYQKKTFAEQLEITHMLGNIAKMRSPEPVEGEGETVVHAHGTFARRDYSVLAGHVKRAVISGACEVSLQKLQGSAERFYDEDTGLNLLQ